MDIEEVKKQIANFEAKLNTISKFTPKERAAAEARRKRIEARTVARKAAQEAKWPEIQKRKGEMILKGIAASPGLAIGNIRNAHNRNHELMAKTKKGEILVVDSFQPEDDVYLRKAVALITDSGGRASSAAISAKINIIPAVTGTVEGTSILQDGQKVIVDGNEGAVYEMISPLSQKVG